MKSGIKFILEERARQIGEEGYTHDNDQKYYQDELVRAALCYASHGIAGLTIKNYEYSNLWPWDMKHWKPVDRFRNIVKAGALLAAELDRMMMVGDLKEIHMDESGVSTPRTEMQKPKLGIIPRGMWLDQRYHELVNSMHRRLENNDPILKEWIEELLELHNEIFHGDV